MEYKTVLLTLEYKVNAAKCVEELDNVINAHAREGWEFAGIETRHILQRPTKGAAFMGKREAVVAMDIAVFKRDDAHAQAFSMPKAAEEIVAKVENLAQRVEGIVTKVDDIAVTADSIANTTEGIADGILEDLLKESDAADQAARSFERDYPPQRDDRYRDERGYADRERGFYRDPRDRGYDERDYSPPRDPRDRDPKNGYDRDRPDNMRPFPKKLF